MSLLSGLWHSIKEKGNGKNTHGENFKSKKLQAILKLLVVMLEKLLLRLELALIQSKALMLIPW